MNRIKSKIKNMGFNDPANKNIGLNEPTISFILHAACVWIIILIPIIKPFSKIVEAVLAPYGFIGWVALFLLALLYLTFIYLLHIAYIGFSILAAYTSVLTKNYTLYILDILSILILCLHIPQSVVHIPMKLYPVQFLYIILVLMFAAYYFLTMEKPIKKETA